ncbi:hypothetical protein FJZ18_02960 [Candidatus Pacearchaeota archaeon]|nr:hypothetical protein [Candidatus Pacearchaeota archaeon]
MNEKEIYSALNRFLSIIKDEKLTWYLEGSVNLFVQGLPVEPNDIDITTTPESLERFRRILGILVTKDFYIKDKGAYLLKASIEDIEFEIAVYEDRKNTSVKTIKNVIWKGLILPTQPLPVALRFYKRIQRHDKVKLIQNFLDENTL